MTLKAIRTISPVLRILCGWALWLVAAALYVVAYRESSWTAMLIGGVAFGIATLVVADMLPSSGAEDP